jgi:maltose alpha-D-glucosyltransferase/alpha-amylase
MALHNLANQDCTVTLKSVDYQHLFDLFGDRPYELLNGDHKTIQLSPHGYRWFRVNRPY